MDVSPDVDWQQAAEDKQAGRLAEARTPNVEHYRIRRMLGLGIPVEHVAALAERVSWHECEQLIRDGCAPERVAAILL